MRIKTAIDGKEISGYWNGKFYKSNKKGHVRIYIDSKEYHVRKEEFKYEEILSEKQLKYAETLKEKFLDLLRKKKTFLYKENVSKEIIEFFERKPITYFLENKHYLDNILTAILSHPFLFEKIFVRKENIYKITDEYKPENRPGNEVIRKVLKLALSYSIRHSSIMHFPKVLEIRKKNDSFIVELNDFEILEIDTNTETCKLLDEDKDLNKPDWGAVLKR
jgi:hypothetical protein